MVDLTDRSLVTQTLAGKRQAFGELVRRYQNTVFNVCYRLAGNRFEAEDLTQEAFIRAYERLTTYNVERAFGPWIRRVAANLCYNHLKKNKINLVTLEEETALPRLRVVDSPEALVTRQEQSEQVRGALNSLPANYRVVLELRHFQGLNYDEIADELDLPLNTVKSQIFRARKLLAKILIERNDD